MGTSVSEPWIGLVSECGVPCFYRQTAWHHSCTIMHHITPSRSGPNKQQYYSPLSPGHQKYVCCISSHHLNFSTARETGINPGTWRFCFSAQRLNAAEKPTGNTKKSWNTLKKRCIYQTELWFSVQKRRCHDVNIMRRHVTEANTFPHRGEWRITKLSNNCLIIAPARLTIT